MRKEIFANGQHYHIFNRGVDKRVVFSDQYDFERFLQSMDEFNSDYPIGSIFENSFRKKDLLGSSTSKCEQNRLVNFICFCVNSNHYHFILEQVAKKGIEKFMHRLGTGYTKYFNQKHERSGALFQGRYKSVHIDSNEYLLHLSVYVNLNDRAHQLGSSTSKSSWEEYMKDIDNKNRSFCKKDIILKQFKNSDDYKKFAEDSLDFIKSRKEMKDFLLE